jgi:CHASE3 domain sensor protein
MNYYIQQIKDYIQEIKDYARANDIKNQFNILISPVEHLYKKDSEEYLRIMDSKYILINEKLLELQDILSKYKDQVNNNNKKHLLEDKIKNLTEQIMCKTFKLFLAH